MKETRLVIIAGPTGVGKTAVSINLARSVNAEIINADSRQVYRFLNIGTAKPTFAERSQVPHHLVDIISPHETFSAAQFVKLAREKIVELEERQKKIFVVGGTGLYIKALTKGLFPGPKSDPLIREKLEKEAISSRIEGLYAKLKNVDPVSAKTIHPNDRQRIIRALEVFLLTGHSIAQFQKAHNFQERPYETLKIALSRPRKELYERINNRVHEMIAAGLTEEIRGLLDSGFGPELPSMTSIGYQYVASFIEGKISIEKAIELLQRDTRRYAKRQLTWFKSDKEYQWYSPDDYDTLLKVIEDFYQEGEK